MSGKVVVDAWLADLTFPNYVDDLINLGRQFEQAHPEYEIRIRGLSFLEAADEIDRAAAEGKRPAIAEYYYTWTQNALDAVDQDGRPLFTSVEKAVAGRTEILGEPVVLDDILPALRTMYTYQGDFRSLPMVATSYHLFTNTTLLRAAGVLDVPETWQDLRLACEKVVRAAGRRTYAITWANHGIPFQQAMTVQGGHIADHGNGRHGRAERVDLTSPEMMAWVSWWRRLHQDHMYCYSGDIHDWYGTFDMFAKQQVVFRLSSSNDIGPSAEAAAEAGFELAVTRFPYNADVPYRGNLAAGTSLWLADGLDEATQDGALAFMQFLNNPRNTAEFHKKRSFIPVSNSGCQLLEGWFAEHPYHRAPNEQLDLVTVGRPSTALVGNYWDIQEVMTRAMHDVMMVRGTDPLARFAKATTEAQGLLDRYLAAHPGGREDRAQAS